MKTNQIDCTSNRNELALEQLDQVAGGAKNVDAVKKMTKLAIETCGAGNVSVVDTKGFYCK
jgi:hypothetical protein